MIQYSAQDRKYPGDEHFRVATKEPKKRRRLYSSSCSAASSSQSSNLPCMLLPSDFVANESRCCEDLTKLMRHISSVEKVNVASSKACVVCGNRAYHICTICGRAMHKLPHGGRSVACFFYYHSTTFLGLARCDYKMMRTSDGRAKKMKDWTFPNEQKQLEHARMCRRILAPPTASTVARLEDAADEY